MADILPEAWYITAFGIMAPIALTLPDKQNMAIRLTTGPGLDRLLDSGIRLITGAPGKNALFRHKIHYSENRD